MDCISNQRLGLVWSLCFYGRRTTLFLAPCDVPFGLPPPLPLPLVRAFILRPLGAAAAERDCGFVAPGLALLEEATDVFFVGLAGGAWEVKCRVEAVRLEGAVSSRVGPAALLRLLRVDEPLNSVVRWGAPATVL